MQTKVSVKVAIDGGSIAILNHILCDKFLQERKKKTPPPHHHHQRDVMADPVKWLRKYNGEYRWARHSTFLADIECEGGRSLLRLCEFVNRSRTSDQWLDKELRRPIIPTSRRAVKTFSLFYSLPRPHPQKDKGVNGSFRLDPEDIPVKNKRKE